MKKKKILLISSKYLVELPELEINYNWVCDEEIKKSFIIEYWGKGYGDLTFNSLKKKVDRFKPDHIYCYNRSKIHKWMPDISSIKVPKIMVELDTYKYDPKDSWYEQFDKLYCRMQNWEMIHSSPLTNKKFIKFFKKSNNKMGGMGDVARQFRRYKYRLENAQKWDKVPLFRWSISKKDLIDAGLKRKGTKFIGSVNYRFYHMRQKLFETFDNKIDFIIEVYSQEYKDILRSSKALICPTESSFGDYVPAKIFEFAASGAAVLTNCDLVSYDMADLDEVVIKYNGLEDLREKIKMDFSPYYDKAREVMKNHTHEIRYKEIFT